MERYGSISSEVRYGEAGELGIRFIQEPADEARLARFLVSLSPPRLPPRHPVQMAARLTVGEVELRGTVADLSSSGARGSLSDTGRLGPGDQVVLHIEGHGELKATVRRLAEGEIGVEFDPTAAAEPTAEAAAEAGAATESTLERLRSWLRRRTS
jgi:hypothetical protein